MKIQNTYFKKWTEGKWMWCSPNGEYYSQIDYILCNENISTHDVSAVNAINTGSDPRLVRAFKLNHK